MIRIGKVLAEAGLVTQEQVEIAVAAQKKSGKQLGQILVNMGVVSEEDVLKCLAAQMHIGFVSLKSMSFPKALLERIPVKYAWHYKVMPVKFEKETLTLAISDPLNVWSLEDIKLHLHMQIEPVLACSTEIDEALGKYYGVGADTIDKILSKDEDRKKASSGHSLDIQDVAKHADEASIIKLVNQIMKEAIESRATDIHFESYENELVIRYRVDGVLQPVKASEDIKFLYPEIVARIKVMAALDIVERRIPQDGGMRIRMGNEEYDLRVSVMPGNHGEGIVIRILPCSMFLDLKQLGVSVKDQEILEKLIQRPHGVLFVTGPTGSGKTTTLYACLNRLSRPEVKIVTVEDPVEYNMKYIEQVQVNPKIELTFARVLRSVLRHDPDIVMVGEVRDLETAQIVIQASLTGHLVLSTLHTNNASSSITRLVDMGVEPYLVSSSVVAVVAQRLLRRNCVFCAKEMSAPPEAALAVEPKITKIKKGSGCEKCRFTGYQGRMAVYEILPFSDAIRALTLKKATATEIEQQGAKEGMVTLFQAAWDVVRQGLTTPEEVYRVIQGSRQ